MKVDIMTKVLLGVIAMNLSIMTIKEMSIMPQVFAGGTVGSVDFKSIPNYGMIPLNEDGSISVSLTSLENINVRIIDDVDVNLVGINSSGSLKVDLSRIGGSSIYSSLPVEIKD